MLFCDLITDNSLRFTLIWCSLFGYSGKKNQGGSWDQAMKSSMSNENNYWQDGNVPNWSGCVNN